MNKIRVGIVGYGNLGHALEETILNEPNLCLVGIFSKRKNISSSHGTPFFEKNMINYFEGKIDVRALCSGSKSDMLVDAPDLARHFDIINTFDTHELIPLELEKLNKISKQAGTLAVVSAGWDPGLFSCARAVFFSCLGVTPTCFWGKGTSLGHSEAAKSVDGVLDAVSLTIPNKKTLKLAKRGLATAAPKHSRKVYVLAAPNEDKKQIEQKIKNIKHYFAEQPTTVKFVNKRQLEQIKSFSHAGKVVATKTTEDGFKCNLTLDISMDSNPSLTAMMIASHLRVWHKLKTKFKNGALTPLHIAPLDLLETDEMSSIKNFM